MRLVLASVSAIAMTLVTVSAFAEIDCPVGTKKKSEGPNDWCEPTVCLTDAQCGAGEVCKTVPLCVEIGTLKGTTEHADGGQRLMARQRCGPDRSCPASTSCLDGNRCISTSDADKMGLLAPAPSASPSAPAASGKKCGCRLVGAPSPARGALFAAAAVALAIGARRRRGDARRDQC
jgi:hypothetical protein